MHDGIRGHSASRRFTPAVALMVMTGRLLASIGQDAQGGPLQNLADWVRDTGPVTVMRGKIIAPIGFPDRDLAVNERGFRERQEPLTHVCAVPSESTGDTLFFAVTDERDGSAIVWRTSKTGHLTGTVRFTGGIAQRVPDEDFHSQFVREKSYFIGKLPPSEPRDAVQATPRDGIAPQPNRELIVEQSTPARVAQRRSLPLQQELLVVATFPWVLPVIVACLVVAARRTIRRTSY